MPDRGRFGELGRDEKHALLAPLAFGHLGAGQRLALALGGGQHIIAESGTAALLHGSIVRYSRRDGNLPASGRCLSFPILGSFDLFPFLLTTSG